MKLVRLRFVSSYVVVGKVIKEWGWESVGAFHTTTGYTGADLINTYVVTERTADFQKGKIEEWPKPISVSEWDTNNNFLIDHKMRGWRDSSGNFWVKPEDVLPLTKRIKI